METVRFGLMLTVIPFVTIFLAITVWWAIADRTLKKIKGPKRTWWTLLAILLPPLGYYLSSSMTEQQEDTPAA
jgi:hypothetical protein